MSSLTVLLLLTAALSALAIVSGCLLALSAVVLWRRWPRPQRIAEEDTTLLMYLPGRRGRRDMDTLETVRVRRRAG